MDRNTTLPIFFDFSKKSLSVRRAWIEMRKITITVDDVTVALRKESVDRNINCMILTRRFCVALRKESVDRNVNLRVLDGSKSSSLSVRRAWIEIGYFGSFGAYSRSRSP